MSFAQASVQYCCHGLSHVIVRDTRSDNQPLLQPFLTVGQQQFQVLDIELDLEVVGLLQSMFFFWISSKSKAAMMLISTTLQMRVSKTWAWWQKVPSVSLNTVNTACAPNTKHRPALNTAASENTDQRSCGVNLELCFLLQLQKWHTHKIDIFTLKMCINTNIKAPQSLHTDKVNSIDIEAQAQIQKHLRNILH